MKLLVYLQAIDKELLSHGAKCFEITLFYAGKTKMTGVSFLTWFLPWACLMQCNAVLVKTSKVRNYSCKTKT